MQTHANRLDAVRLPAAVIDPKIHGPAAVARSARAVPMDANRIVCGMAQLGYQHDPRRKAPPPIGSTRMREIERLIRHRYGGPCDCDDGEPYLYVVANGMAQQLFLASVGRSEGPAPFVEKWLRNWASKSTPRIAPAKIEFAIQQAVAKPRWWRADSAAKLLRLTKAERDACKITTIGAIDCDKDARAELRKQRKRDAQRARDEAKRRANGAQTRAEYESDTIAAQARAAGISRSTAHRRLKAGLPISKGKCDRSSVQQKKVSSDVGQTTCVNPTQAPNILRYPSLPNGRLVCGATTERGRRLRIAQAACASLGYRADDKILGVYADAFLMDRIPDRAFRVLESRLRDRTLGELPVAIIARSLSIPPGPRGPNSLGVSACV